MGTPCSMPIASTTAMTDVAFAGLAEHAAMLDRGEISSRELTELFLARIERHDPALNAFRVVTDELALAEAAQADARRRSGDRRPLLGIPLAIKDDTDIQGQLTAMGSCAVEEPATADSEVVRRLRSAGAVILGKTHVPEMMIVPFTETPTFGITRNPWDLQRTPGGSSGGSGAAVAAGLCSAALGSDGGGSIRIPAGCCGLFGLKPQRGRVPTAPFVEPWHGLSTWGPITRRVADSARFYDAIRDGGESFTEAAAREPGKLRIAVTSNVPPVIATRPDAEQLGALSGTADLLRSLGHEVVERDFPWGPGVRQLPRPLPARRPRRGAEDAAPGAILAPYARLHADGLADPGRGARPRPLRGGQGPRPRGDDLLRRVRPRRDADVRAPPAEGDVPRRPLGVLDAHLQRPLDARTRPCSTTPASPQRRCRPGSRATASR